MADKLNEQMTIDVDETEVVEIVGGGSSDEEKPKKIDRRRKWDPKRKQGVGPANKRDKENFDKKHNAMTMIAEKNRTVIGLPNNLELSEGKNTKYTGFAVEVGKIGWPDYNDPESLRQNGEKYFSLCAEWDCKPAAVGLALALKLDRRRLWDIVNDQPRAPKMPKASADMIKFLYQYLDVLWEQWMLNGAVNPASGIFLGINNFGYHNEQNIIVQPAVADNGADVEAIEAKYSDLPEE